MIAGICLQDYVFSFTKLYFVDKMIPLTERNPKLVLYYVDLKSLLIMHYGLLLVLILTPSFSLLKPALLSNR